MKTLVKKVPLAISGLALALVANGNLMKSYGELYRSILGTISAVLVIFILSKIILHGEIVREELKNPVVFSSLPTLTMAIMLLSVYIKPLSVNISFVIWIAGLLGHIGLMVKFTIDYIIKLDIKKVFPSWFIVYVGVVVGSVTAPAFEMEKIGRVLFWIGFVSYLLLLPLIIKKVRLKTIPQPALPTIAIFAAPAALLLAGYISSFSEKSLLMVWALFIVSQVSYIYVLTQVFKLIKAGFYPSFSALTFPLAISAISVKLTNGFLTNIGRGIGFLKYLVKFEETAALLIVIYVLFKYIKFLSIPLPMKKQP